MFRPHDPLAPRQPQFSEGWHAQALALADTLVATGHFSAQDWASKLGQSLQDAQDCGAPDTEDTYYGAVVTALEQLVTEHTNIDAAKMFARKQAWITAYKTTPHGAPVKLT